MVRERYLSLCVWLGGEIVAPRPVVAVPAGRSREVEARESYPAKTLCRQISAVTAGKTRHLSLPASREGCRPRAVMLRIFDRLSVSSGVS